MTATELAHRIRARELSAREVMDAHLAQIDRVNPTVNAIVTLLPEQAMEQARAADEALARGEEVGPLHGLPIAHKDLVPTRGIRTTSGSPIFEDCVPDEDGLIVERLKKAGAITVGKTNTPEFGAGSQTYNEVFGETLNPYDTGKTCGGSSGGAAVALACGMQPIADGSDLGGSLRNPASFCNVVGFRTSPGRVPVWPNPSPSRDRWPARCRTQRSC
jgi:amidase